MFYDENGKHVRTKKEILEEDGEIREGCRIVKKGEVYEKKLFTAKDERFKSNSFLDEIKHSYTDLINIYVQDKSQKLQVFERGSVYLATKKIGKNNTTTTGGAALKFYASIRAAFYSGRSITVKQKEKAFLK